MNLRIGPWLTGTLIFALMMSGSAWSGESEEKEKDGEGGDAKTEPAIDPARGASAYASDFEEITPELDRAVENGLKFLRKTQKPGGYWESAGGRYPVAMTALAGMAFLSAGKTPGRGQDGELLMKSVRYLLKNHQRRGLFDSNREGSQPMYGHGFATTFLSQVYGMEVGDEGLREEIRLKLTAAVKLTAEAQSVEGGWYYSPHRGNHEGSVTVTQMHGLRAARNVGIEVNERTIPKLVAYMKGSQNTDGSINYRYGRRQSGGRPALTAAGVEVFLAAGQYHAPHTQKAMKNLRAILNNANSSRHWGHDVYFTYYAAHACFQFSREDWKRHFPMFRKKLINAQNKTTGAWRGDHIGPVYGTSMYIQVLCLPYRYLPIFQR